MAVGSAGDRAWAYVTLGDIYAGKRDLPAAEHAYKEAAALNPNLFAVWDSLGRLASRQLNDDERAAGYYRRAATATDLGGGDTDATSFTQLQDATFYDERVGDFLTALKRLTAESDRTRDLDVIYTSAYYAAFEAAYDHDIEATNLWLERSRDRAAGASPAIRRADPVPRILYWKAVSVEDWQAAADHMAGVTAELARNNGSSDYWSSLQAIALAHAGKAAEAKAIVDPLSVNSMTLLAAAVTDEAAGDRTAADAKFAQAVALTPSLVRARTWWGQAKLARGDLDGATVLFRQAAERGPHYADPQEGWGEALLAKGDAAGAVRHFAEAHRWAPNWGKNHLRWGQALLRLSKAGDAKHQLDIAAGLDLSATDRATLATLRR